MSNAMNVETAQPTVSAILRAGKAVIADEKNWIKRQYAWAKHTGTGNDDDCVADEQFATDGYDNRAFCWCSVGALQKVTGQKETNNNESLIDKAVNILCTVVGNITEGNNTTIYEYNDTHTHEEVMAVWDKAIAAAEAEEVRDDVPAGVTYRADRANEE